MMGLAARATRVCDRNDIAEQSLQHVATQRGLATKSAGPCSEARTSQPSTAWFAFNVPE